MSPRPTWAMPPLRTLPPAPAPPAARASLTPARPLPRLRRAERRDVATLRRWDDEPHVRAASGSDDAMDWERDVSRAHPWQKILIMELHAAEGARPIGVVVIIDPAEEETAYWAPVAPNLRAIDIWIGEKDCLARGYGSALMAQALEICFGEGCDAVLVDPLLNNVRAHRFYRKMGFREIGVRQFGGDTCLVHRIEREDYQRNNEGA